MKYDFSKRIDRVGTTSYKWQDSNEETISMTVADMDFEVAPFIKDALYKRIEHGVFGYDSLGEDYYSSIINWYKRRYHINIEKEWIHYAVGVIPAIRSIILSLVKEDEKILLTSPVYATFYKVIEEAKRQVIESELNYRDGEYTINFSDLEEKLALNTTKIMILCSPHNPIGRIWTKEEIEKVIELCKKYDVILLSDEIHGDLVHKDENYVSLLSYIDYLENLIVCVAPTKTFNLAGIRTSSVIIKNKELGAVVADRLSKNKMDFNNTFSAPLTVAAYNEGEEWLDELLAYLQENHKFIKNYFKENLPQVKVTDIQATYLQWIDCSSFASNTEHFCKFLEENYNLRLQPGENFGSGGRGFVRMNYACSREVLEKALERFKNAVLAYKELN